MVFLQGAHGLHLLLVVTFVLVHHALALIMLIYDYWLGHLSYNRGFLNLNVNRPFSASHRGTSTPVVVVATRSPLTNNFVWAFFFVDAAPVMIRTHFVSGTNFFNRCPFVPVMVVAPWTIFADDSLLLTFGAVLTEEFFIFRGRPL